MCYKSITYRRNICTFLDKMSAFAVSKKKNNEKMKYYKKILNYLILVMTFITSSLGQDLEEGDITISLTLLNTGWFTYGSFVSEKNNLSILLPKGFANAYMTLKNNTKILYYMSAYYKPSKEKSIRYNDKFFSIKWPSKPKCISTKDSSIPDFNLNE